MMMFGRRRKTALSLGLLAFVALIVSLLVVPSRALASSGSASDNFARANGSLGPNWTDMSGGGLAISSQTVVGTKASANSGDMWTGTTFGSDQYSSIQVTSTPMTGGEWIGPVVRAQNGGQNLYTGIYYWNYGSPELMLFRRTGGGWGQLGSTYASGVLAAGTQLELTAVGSTLAFMENGVAEITASDTSFTGGAPGIMAFGTSSSGSWTGGNAAGSYSIGGGVTGLTGTVVLENNGGDPLSMSANGSFTFDTLLAGGASYNVTVETNPAGQSCTVSNGTGTVASSNVTSVSVTCGSYSIGGGVTNLTGTVVLENNGGDPLAVSSNGSFTFDTLVAAGATYDVTVEINPSGQNCTVANGAGTVASSNVTNVSVTCGIYSIGGSVAGLSGIVVLENNGVDPLSVSANGSFTFDTLLTAGAAYNVTVTGNPSGQGCTVTNGTGTVASSNVTNVSVACTAQSAGSGASDNFARANGSLGPNWTDMSDGGLAISSQAVVGTDASANSGDMWTGTTFGSDQYSSIQVTSTPMTGGEWIGPVVRAQNGGQDLYMGIYYWNGGSPQLILYAVTAQAGLSSVLTPAVSSRRAPNWS